MYVIEYAIDVFPLACAIVGAAVGFSKQHTCGENVT